MKSSRAPLIQFIVIHCQAGHGTLESMQKYWKTLGWKSPGYHAWIDYDGTVHYLAGYEQITNGVAGFNSHCLHICYRGGVEQTNVNKAKDTRTQAQKDAILKEILRMEQWLEENGKDTKRDLMILGHYHFSDDKNKNGAIESWERIKSCPSFDAFTEYKYLTVSATNTEAMQKLPKNRLK